MNHRNDIIQSLAYKFTERVAVKLIGFVISIILARLLDPAVFGLLAILQVFINISQIFVQGGLNVALIQNKDTSEEDYSTVFWISLVIAVQFYIGLFAAAPLIARFYSSTELISPLRVLSLCMLFGAFNSVQTAKLSREMQFRKQMVCNLAATVVSGVIGIVLAFWGFGLWALVVYNVVQQVAVCIAMLTAVKWTPRFVFSKARAVTMVNYGWKILIANILYSLYTDLRSLIIGKAYSVDELAIYDRGNQLPNIVCNNLDTAIQAVMLPALSKDQNKMDRIRVDLSQMICMITYLVTPIMIGIAALARPFVLFFLSAKWEGCISYMVIFSLGYVFSPIAGACNVAIKSIGRADVFAKSQAVRIAALFALLIVSTTMFHDVYAIVIGYALGLFLEMIIAMWMASRYIHYTFRQLAEDFLPSLMAASVMGIAVYCITLFVKSYVFSMLFGTISGVAIYLLFSWTFKLRAFTAVWKLLKQLLHR